MKKRLFSLLTSLALVVSLLAVLPAMTASAYYKYGDYEYDIMQNGTIVIMKYNGTASKLTIPSTLGAGKVKVTAIGEQAFMNNMYLTSVTIPNTVKQIANEAFWNCKNLTSVSIPSSVTSIGDYAFYSCQSLKTVLIPGSVKTIGYEAFYYCTSLSKVGLGSGIQKIDQFAFEDCYSLTYVTIPKSVTYIGQYAFGSKYNSATDEDVIIYNFKINCYAGSQALEYAKYFGIPYNLITTTSTTPANVTGFKVVATSANAVKLSWNKVSGATGYVVFRAAAGKWVRVGVVKSNVFLNQKLASGTNYRYAVRAYRTVGGKNYYSKSYPTLWTSTKPATVNFTLTPGAGKVVMKWPKVRGATQYFGYIKFSANGSWNLLTNTKYNNMTVSGLTRGRTYWFTVRAVRTALGKNYWGAFTTKSVKAK